jgi:PAS domain S-box-containing protein
MIADSIRATNSGGYPRSPTLHSITNPPGDRNDSILDRDSPRSRGERQNVVLVVNDNPDQLEFMDVLMRQSGYEVLTATDGRVGLEVARAAHPDLIISDVSMPRLNGIEMCRLIREQPEMSVVPILLVSAIHKDSETVIEGLKAGADDYLELPFDPMQMVTKAARLIERKLSDERLKKSEAQLAEAQRVAHIGSFEWEIARNKCDWSDELYRILGLEPQSVAVCDEMLSRHLTPGHRELGRQAIEKAIRIQEPFLYELPVRRADGTARILQIRGQAVTDLTGGVVRVIGTAQDVTELKQTEEALRRSEEQFLQSQKMEAIGQLAGGVAHDFNNLLTAITGYSDLTLLKLNKADPLRRNIEEIKKAGDRAASLTRQLLAFSRRQVLQPQVLDLNSIIEDMGRMLPRLIGENIELRMVLDPGLGMVKADPGQIEQVILNLAVNARDAMPRGGKLMIETKNVYLHEEYVGSHLDATPGPYTQIVVTDTGHGINEETKKHIFEPFFTTKEAGKGTGLGLSTVYGIVKQSGGSIWVYSEVGRGTAFKVYLPRVGEKPDEHRRRAEAREAPQGAETILLVEDEEILRMLMTEVLEANGYSVFKATDSETAILFCEGHQGPIHLLLTDVVMPGIGGRALAEQLVAIRPDMRVLYMSGYTSDSIVHNGVLDEEMSFLQKPFTPASLAQKVREVLEERMKDEG